MAEGPGGAKNGDSGPVTPKISSTRTLANARTRDYYNSETPGVSQRKTKTAQRNSSPSHSETNQAEQSYRRTSNPSPENNPRTKDTASHHDSNNLNSPHEATQEDNEEYIGCDEYMNDEYFNFQKEDPLADFPNMDAPKIKERMNDVMRDIQMMLNTQTSDVFHFSEWIEAILSLAGLKSCYEDEWEMFSKHFNRETGEITAYSPFEHFETLEPINSSPGTNDKNTKKDDEITSLRADIATMKSTMVDLAETVNKLVTNSGNQDIPTIRTNPPTQPNNHQTPPRPEPNHEPRWVKSANPTVIKPTRKNTPDNKNTDPSDLKKPTANPHRLILQFNPPIPEAERKNADLVRLEMNNLLKSLDVPIYFRVMAVNWSRSGNPIITTTSSGRAEDLLEHTEKLGKILTNNTLVSALPDSVFYRAKVNLIGTKDYRGIVRNNMDIHNELMEYVPGYNNLRHASPPRWLGNLEYLEAKSQSSMVFSFTTAEDRDKFLGYGPVWLFNQQCTITVYEDRPQIFSCRNCGSFSHKSCESPACLKCGGKDHTTESHPMDAPLRCINCHKEHAANYTNCNRRRKLLGLNPMPDAKDTHSKPKKAPKKPTKPRAQTTENPTPTNNSVGLNGNQLIEAVTNEGNDTPAKLRVSSAIHEITQANVNRSSQRLKEKALGKQRASQSNSTTAMEGVEATDLNK